MLDFVRISVRSGKKGVIEIYPKFVIKNPSEDLMIRGGDFYAIWNEELGIWSTNEQDVIDTVDRLTDEFANEYKAKEVIDKYCSFMPVPIYFTNEDAGQLTDDIPEEEVIISTRQVLFPKTYIKQQVWQNSNFGV